MALPALAELADLETRLRRTFDSSADSDWAQSVLDEATVIVRAESGKDWVDPDDPTKSNAPDIVKTIVLRVAERAIRNPDGYSSESAGDYSYQRNGVSSDGGLYLSDWERRMLTDTAKRRGMWTQPVTRGESGDATLWMEDSYGLEPFPVDVNYGFLA